MKKSFLNLGDQYMQDINLDLISTSKTQGMGEMEKIQYILDKVKEGKIVIVEEGLTPSEESTLVEQTMIGINEEFTGIEIESYKEKPNTSSSVLSKLLSSFTTKTTPKLIGPADKVESIYKDTEHLKTRIQ